MSYRVGFLSVVPSPYQRDLFRALAGQSDLDLSVFYLESESPDSPWPAKPLADYESILPGFWLPLGEARCHLNHSLPDVSLFDVFVFNSLMSFTAQGMIRLRMARRPWLFWGERLQGRGCVHNLLTSPLHHAAGIAAIGTLALRDYEERFPEPQHFNIPYHCDLGPFLNTPRPPRNKVELVFLFCGQMIERKGIDLLLEAFQRLAEKYAQVKLLLLGREAGLQTLLKPLPETTRARIIYAGFQPPDELPRYFAQADVFVLPSRHDGWGVVVNQALGAGLPIVCSDAVGAGHDLIEPGINGERFEPDSSEALFVAMERFAANPELARTWGAESRRKASAWTPECGAVKWVEAFERVLHK